MPGMRSTTRPRTAPPTTCALLGVLTLAAHSWAQAIPKPVYVESFRKGPTRLAELLLVANLTSQNADYKATVKDSKGNDRFQLFLEPAREAGGAERIVSWRALLIESPATLPGKLPGRDQTSRAAFGPASGSCLVAGSESLRHSPPASQARVQGGRFLLRYPGEGLSRTTRKPPAGLDDGGNTVYGDRSPAE